ncbi:MAG: NADH-quinone oxidoreductase subunit M, partial [Pikeienuella sp.]
MENLPLLTIITALPAIAALIIFAFVKGESETAVNNVRWVALFGTIFTFVFSLFMLAGFDSANTGFQFTEERDWLGIMTYRMGVDGISVLFVMLTTFLMPLVIWSSWGVTHRVKEYMIAFLLLETLMIGVFCALDM